MPEFAAMSQEATLSQQQSVAITQRGNTAGHDIVGRDKNTTHIYQSVTPSPSAVLLDLLRRLKEEIGNDSKVETMLEELKRYHEPISKVTRTLEEKLTDGARSDSIGTALEAKEMFAKKLARFSLFQSAQEIHALVLARIWSLFRHQIHPLIVRGVAREHVESTIQNVIIQPLVAELYVAPLRYCDPEIYGMLYFLTGNCHIEWS